MIFAAGSRLRGILKIPVIENAEVVCEQNITGADQQQFPQMLENFTRYPLKQPKTGSYKSGTLSAYLGKVD